MTSTLSLHSAIGTSCRKRELSVLVVPWRVSRHAGVVRVFGEGGACSSVAAVEGAVTEMRLGVPHILSGLTWDPAPAHFSEVGEAEEVRGGEARAEALLRSFLHAIRLAPEEAEDALVAWRSSRGPTPSLAAAVLATPPKIMAPSRPPMTLSRAPPVILDREMLMRLALGFVGMSTVYIVQVETDTCARTLYTSFPHASKTRRGTCWRKTTRNADGGIHCSECGPLDASTAEEVSMWKCPLLVSSVPASPHRRLDACVEVMLFEESATQLFGVRGDEFARAPTLYQLELLASVEERCAVIEWKVSNSDRRGVHERQVIVTRVLS